MVRSSKWLGRNPFKVVIRVRFPYALLNLKTTNYEQRSINQVAYCSFSI